jgi:hypothetical protein
MSQCILAVKLLYEIFFKSLKKYLKLTVYLREQDLKEAPSWITST